ncbi:MAG TPA: arsenic resistance protein [Spirochaetes bacterium]|nr:arsenic resistance protein [Spirochaetota bacterium]
MNNFNLTVRKYILLWVFIAMVAGYLAGRYNPERVVKLEFLLTPLAFLMIFIMVFPPNLSSLLKIKFYIYPLLVSFILFIASPLMAYTVSYIIPQKYNFLRTGIIISSTVPPNAMLSAWTSFLEGDIILTLIIQSFSSFIALGIMPFGLPLLFEDTSYFSFRILITNIGFLIVIPIVLGGLIKLIFRNIFTIDVLKKIKPTLSSVSGIIEIFIILISVALRAEIIKNNPVIIIWGVLTAYCYYAVCFILAIFVSRLFNFPYETAIPLIYQNGSKNLSVAMVVAITSFKSQAVLGVAASILAQFPASAFFYSISIRYLRKKSIDNP